MGNPFGLDTHPSTPPPVKVTVWPRQKAWSYSAVSQHKKCPLAFRFRRIDRLPEPEGAPLLRGHDIHAHLAHYLTHGHWIPDSPNTPSDHWKGALDALRERGAKPEQQVAFNKDWIPVAWYAPDAFVRVVFDAIIMERDYIEIIEFKSGKVYPEHEQQKRLYALAAMKYHPPAQIGGVRLWYIDQKEEGDSYAAHRHSVPMLEVEFENFPREFLQDTLYPARPGVHCRWCHFRRSNGGPCEFG